MPKIFLFGRILASHIPTTGNNEEDGQDVTNGLIVIGKMVARGVRSLSGLDLFVVDFDCGLLIQGRRLSETIRSQLSILIYSFHACNNTPEQRTRHSEAVERSKNLELSIFARLCHANSALVFAIEIARLIGQIWRAMASRSTFEKILLLFASGPRETAQSGAVCIENYSKKLRGREKPVIFILDATVVLPIMSQSA
ncbi:hypothetical protein KCU90_g109, partial [Aureobasidium melanogenum]